MIKYRGTDGFLPIDEFDQPWDKYKDLIRPGAVIIDATGVTYACDKKQDTCEKLRNFLTVALQTTDDLELHFVVRSSKTYNSKLPLQYTGRVPGKHMSASQIQATSQFQMICSFIGTIPKEARCYVHVVGLPMKNYEGARARIEQQFGPGERERYLHLLDEVDDAYISYLDVRTRIDFSVDKPNMVEALATTKVVLSKDANILNTDKKLWYESTDDSLQALHEIISANKYVICFKQSKCIYDFKQNDSGTQYRVINMPCVVDVSPEWFRVG
jgi:hypothetical protein